MRSDLHRQGAEITDDHDGMAGEQAATEHIVDPAVGQINRRQVMELGIRCLGTSVTDPRLDRPVGQK